MRRRAATIRRKELVYFHEERTSNPFKIDGSDGKMCIVNAYFEAFAAHRLTPAWMSGYRVPYAQRFLERPCAPPEAAREWRSRIATCSITGIYILHAIALFGERMWGIRVFDLIGVVVLGCLAARFTTRRRHLACTRRAGRDRPRRQRPLHMDF